MCALPLGAWQLPKKHGISHTLVYLSKACFHATISCVSVRTAFKSLDTVQVFDHVLSPCGLAPHTYVDPVKAAELYALMASHEQTSPEGEEDVS